MRLSLKGNISRSGFYAKCFGLKVKSCSKYGVAREKRKTVRKKAKNNFFAETVVETFRGTLPPGPTPPAPTQLNPLRLDLISTRFRPDLDLKSRFSGPNQVEIGSKSGPNQVWVDGFGWVGAGGIGPVGGGSL